MGNEIIAIILHENSFGKVLLNIFSYRTEKWICFNNFNNKTFWTLDTIS